MTLALRSKARTLLSIAVVLTGSACAGSLPDVEAIDVPRLEEAVASSPDNTGLQVQLGMAQFKARDFETAQTTLNGAIEAGEQSGAAYLYLGMASEELEDWSTARDAYNTYLTVGVSAEARDEIRTRLTMIGRNLLHAQSRQALAQEEEITATAAVTPQSIAVMPLAFNSDNVDLEPLIYALSDMMVTDFKVSNALVVLERAQIQTLLDEMALNTGEYAEPGTGARTGLLLRAEHVVQGVLTTLGESELQADMDILNVPNSASAGTVSEASQLEQLFDMEKAIVIRTIREVLGIQLTPAEEQAILENRWTNVLAFLAYGRGLRELDRGNYAGAQAQFQQAAQLEPQSFLSLEAATQEAAALSETEDTDTDDLQPSVGGETGPGVVAPPDINVVGPPPDQPVGPGAVTNPATGPSIGATTLSGLTGAIDPVGTDAILGQATITQNADQTNQQTQDTSRQPVQEPVDPISQPPGAQIRIVIRRPGSLQ